ncbi:MAG: hypothetical protein K2K53_01220 [Oscillospiraceae bacterium]|nr:hypothetical protein [Oscillospiraceae bacterium]
MGKRKWAAAAVLSAVLFAAACYVSAWLLTPSRKDYGSTWESYLQEEPNSVDVLFFGSSLAYCDIVPGVIWQESGLATYVMAGPEQTMPITYRYVREACKTQSPEVVAVEITGLFYPRYCGSTMANIFYMPWSPNRLMATLSGAEPELRASLLFPILYYHSRWKEVSAPELAAHFQPDVDMMAGYTYLDGIAPQGEVSYRDFTAGDENYQRNLGYLRRIADYCQENGIRLLLFLSPAVGQIPPEALARLQEDVSALPNATFADFNGIVGEIGIDNGMDWYDFLHFNCYGADKFSKYLAGYLEQELDLAPTEGADEALWAARAAEFAARKAASAG